VSHPIRLAHQPHEHAEAYRAGSDRPLGSYLGLMASYLGAVGVVGAVVRRRATLPERPAPADLALVAVATYRTSRLLTKDSVTSPLRAPFTRYEGAAGNAELHEQVRGEGLQKAIGELVTCPFCLGQWIATSFTAGMLLAPRATRQVTGLLSTLAVADALHLLRARLERSLD
jgi:hypothetical protein